MDLFETIWKDPVWSKVIAAAIIPVLSLFKKKVRLFIFSFFKRFIPGRQNNQENNKNIKAKNTKKADLEEWVFVDTIDFFERRFSSAFPGLREPKWFFKKEAVNRLMALLRNPLVFKSGENSWVKPLWWWADGNSDITKCQRLGRTKLLMDYYELDIDKICAVYHKSAKRMFVYVQTKAMKPTGLYRKQELNLNDHEDQIFLREEYGLFKNKLITLSEFDDGAAEINGKIVDTMSRAELRVRCITPFIFLIAPNESIINNSDFDEILKDYIRRILKSEITPEQLFTHIFHLQPDLHQRLRELNKYR
jgi:hypothetical protein